MNAADEGLHTVVWTELDTRELSIIFKPETTTVKYLYFNANTKKMLYVNFEEAMGQSPSCGVERCSPINWYFMEQESSLPRTQEPDCGSYSKP
jgi:hypothetical protein